MTRPLAVVALLALSGCVSQPRPGPWRVTGGTEAETRQALAIAEAAKRVLPGTPLDWGGEILLAPEVATKCYGVWGMGKPVSGCSSKGSVMVLWPHPKNPGCFDLAGCSALAHELAHVADWHFDEDQASAMGLLIVLEYRKGIP